MFGNKTLELNIEKIFLLGSSFGATVALDVETDVFDKIVAVSPLIKYKEHKIVIDDLLDK
ncbi:MAG: hypothetical protein PF488_03630 [Patescibacteria group bacterium]|nr:hypothetical protein [Patescibacteria group bacterium]